MDILDKQQGTAVDVGVVYNRDIEDHAGDRVVVDFTIDDDSNSLVITFGKQELWVPLDRLRQIL